MSPGKRSLVVAGVVLVAHLLAGFAHGVPHDAIPVRLSDAQWLFVVLIATVAPVAGFAAAWRGRARLGAVVYTVAMLAAFVFGIYHHFLVSNPDNIAAVSPGAWRGPFVWTAVLVALTDAAGIAAGAYLWLGGSDAPTAE